MGSSTLTKYGVFVDQYRNIVNQSIIISGESGAGKTEAAKLCLDFICQAARRRGPWASPSWESTGLVEKVSQTIASATLVMEAMGNARTPRNPNSSRFGKYIEVHFSHQGGMTGASFSPYLLEKTRAASHGPDESNYHILYMLLAAPAEVTSRISLTHDWSAYACLRNAASSSASLQSTPTSFSQLDRALDTMRNGNDSIGSMKMDLYVMLALILHLSNLQFVEGEGGDDAHLSVVADDALVHCTRLMQCSTESLQKVLTFRTIGGGAMETFSKPFEMKGAFAVRSTLCMHIYELAFDWAVKALNAQAPASALDPSIGVLDVFGFENFVTNGFGQLCINFANECLQQLFLEHVYELERLERAEEGINLLGATSL